MFYKMMRKARKNQKGFTLVELMVVVVIIGILTAIAIPQFSRVTERAERAGVEANLRTIEGTIMMYTADHGAPGDQQIGADPAGPIESFLQLAPDGPVVEARYGIYDAGDGPRAFFWVYSSAEVKVGGENIPGRTDVLGANTDGMYMLETLPW